MKVSHHKRIQNPGALISRRVGPKPGLNHHVKEKTSDMEDGVDSTYSSTFVVAGTSACRLPGIV